MKRIVSIVTLAAVALVGIPGSFSDALSQNIIRPGQKLLQVAPRKPLVMQRSMMRYEAVRVKTLDRNGARGVLWNLQKFAAQPPGFEKVEEIDGRYIFSATKDPSAVFDIDARTGSFLVNYGLKRYSTEGSTRNLPSAGAAEDLARSYLAKAGYLPQNEQEMVLAGVGGMDMAVAKDGKTRGPYKKLVTVRFSRVLNGMQVQGPGSRLVVHLGENGEMTGMIWNWPEVKAIAVSAKQQKNSEVIRQETAERLRLLAGEAKEILGRKSVQVLYDDGQGHIEPAIYVTAVARYEGPVNEGFVDIPVDFYIPLLRSSKAVFPFMKDRDIRKPDDEKPQKRGSVIAPMRTGDDEQSDLH